GKVAVCSILAVSSHKQEGIFAQDHTYDATCADGHKSIYFLNQMVEVHRKLSPLEQQTEPELLNDDRFVDLEDCRVCKGKGVGCEHCRGAGTVVVDKGVN
ncbi:MAG: hypothetical protein ACRD4M_03480, partial [Candidatus Acidiferrales bacterium]